MNNLILPPIGIVARFKVASPYDKVLSPDIEYKVSAIRSIRDLLKNGIRVSDIIYKRFGLTDKDYIYALENEIPIVFFETSDNETIYVPANYILSAPILTEFKYVQKTILVNLGFLPIDMNVEFLYPLIKELIASKLGVEANIKTIDTSDPVLFTEEEDKEFKLKREALLKDYVSISDTLKENEIIIKNLKEKEKFLVKRLVELEKFNKANESKSH